MPQTAEMPDVASPPVFTVDGARATIRLNRPRHLNRLQAEDLDVLLKLFSQIENDPTLRVLVLTGNGRAFSAGYDLNSVSERAVVVSHGRVSLPRANGLHGIEATSSDSQKGSISRSSSRYRRL